MLSLLSKNKFVLTVGDDGAVLSFFKRGQLHERLFAASLNSAESEAMASLCRAHRYSPIYVLVDIVDQSYVQHFIPPVSTFSINSIIKRKLERDFPPGDIKAATKIGRVEKGRKDWSYMFVSVRNVPPFSEWIDMALELPNHFAGIYMLPLEAELTISDLDKAVEVQKLNKGAKWKILVTHDRVGGVRQIVLRDGKLMLTRMNQPINNSAPDVMAGNIEQDLANTLEFIRRVGFDEKDGFDVFVIVSAEVKQYLEMAKLQANSIFLFTPFEAATRLNIPNTAEENDKYSDVLLAANFVLKKRHVLKFHTPYADKLERLYMADMGSKILAAVFFFGVLLFSVYLVISYISLSSDMRVAEGVEREDDLKLKGVKDESNAFPIEIGKILDAIYLKDRMEAGRTKILDLITLFSEAKTNDSLVRQINAKAVDLGFDKKESEPKLNATFIVEILSSGKKIEETIEQSNMLVDKINAEFEKNYDVKFTNLPGKNSINTNLDKKPESAGVTSVTVIVQSPKAKSKVPAKAHAPSVPPTPDNKNQK